MNFIIDEISRILKEKESMIVAIDGRCAAGKSTLAEMISSYFPSNIIHMDDFFLRPIQRTLKRLNTPGGNSDTERFKDEVIVPLVSGVDFSYRPFVCKSMTFGEEIKVAKKPLTIVEGSYSCHPDLFDYYDLHIFCDIDKDIQQQRLIKRNPENINDFNSKWIPMEEKYFDFFQIQTKCEIIHRER